MAFRTGDDTGYPSMSGPNGEECRKCYFAELWGDDSGDGDDDPYLCHRYPASQKVDLRANGVEFFHTTTPGGDWCGEFKERPK